MYYLDYTIKRIQHAPLHALLLSTHSSILQKAFDKWDPFGAIGRFPWSDTVGSCNLSSEAVVFLTQPLTDLLLKMLNSLKLVFCMMLSKSFHCRHQRDQCKGSHTLTVSNLLLLWNLEESLYFQDGSCMLLPPSRSGMVPDSKVALIAAALVTRSAHPEATPVAVAGGSAQSKKRRRPAITAVKKLVQQATIVEWGKVKRVDSEEGDTMASSKMGRRGDDRRDNTFVRVSECALNTLVPSHMLPSQIVV
jgi:hypothetical protein